MPKTKINLCNYCGGILKVITLLSDPPKYQVNCELCGMRSGYYESYDDAIAINGKEGFIDESAKRHYNC